MGSQRLAQNVGVLIDTMGASPSPFVFAQLWFLCAAVRLSIDGEAWAEIGGKANGKVKSDSQTRVEKD